MNYHKALLKVIDYIDSHLEEELSVDCLSEVACLSKYHFHRLFFQAIGLNVEQYIKQLRFKRASLQLLYRPNMQIIDVALASGYQSHEAFSRAFKQFVGQSPRDFRGQPVWHAWYDKYQLQRKLRSNLMQKSNKLFDVDIVNFEQVDVALLIHQGAPALLGQSIQRFISWRKQHGLSPTQSRTFNFVYDDPSTTDPEDYRFGLAVELSKSDVVLAEGFSKALIPSGRCAYIRYQGSDDGLANVVNYLYGEWLIHSKEELADFPLFFERIKFFPEVTESQAITDIYLPLRGEL